MSTEVAGARSEGLRPILKWAGGKTQLLPQIRSMMPPVYKTYLEPFVGGGALFFDLCPRSAVIGDSNPELINLYRRLADSAEKVADALALMPISSDDFYRFRSMPWEELEPISAAARTIYLNRLCFNGLYRVNRKGEFNVPFGNYKRPSFPSRETLSRAGQLLSKATILNSDYLDLLRDHASRGDFVFMDPPYIPVSKYSDFKRYNPKQFNNSDHVDLANEVRRLVDLGCCVVLTNSNHSLVHELFADFELHVVETKRNINSRGRERRGQDVLVVANGF